MKKTLLATSMALTLGAATSANAAFTAMADGNYQLTVTGGCFDFANCQTLGSGTFADNTTANQATAGAFGSPAGSGISNDGLMGVIDFTLTGGNISVTSFSQDSYLGTTGGTFYLRAADTSSMGGTIDNLGNMTFDPTGRTGLAALFAGTLGEQAWNLDNSVASPGGTGLYDVWTTGSDTNRPQGFASGFTVNGSALQDAGAGMWTGTLASAGNIGTAWGDFDSQQYAEIFNVTITAAGTPPEVPVPAAVWLFGSGLVGLVGVARRRKKA